MINECEAAIFLKYKLYTMIPVMLLAMMLILINLPLTGRHPINEPGPALAGRRPQLIRFLIEILMETGPIQLQPAGGPKSLNSYLEP